MGEFIVMDLTVAVGIIVIGYFAAQLKDDEEDDGKLGGKGNGLSILLLAGNFSNTSIPFPFSPPLSPLPDSSWELIVNGVVEGEFIFELWLVAVVQLLQYRLCWLWLWLWL